MTDLRGTRRAILRGASVPLLASIAGCSDLFNQTQSEKSGSSLDINAVTIRPVREDIATPIVGVAATVEVEFSNVSEEETNVDLTLSTDGEEVATETMTVEAGETETWSIEHTFESGGTHEIQVADVTETVGIVEPDEPSVDAEVRGVHVNRADRDDGVVRTWLRVENPQNVPTTLETEIAVDGDEPERFWRVDEDEVRDASETVPVIGANETSVFVAERTVTADDTYKVSLDGDEVGEADLRVRDARYRLGTPDRQGTRLPSGGIGWQPELLKQFKIEPPEGISKENGAYYIEPLAVTEEVLYVKTIFRDGEAITAFDRWSGEIRWNEPVGAPTEVAVVGDTAYVLGGGVLRARDGDSRDLELFDDDYWGTYPDTAMVTDGELLYVGTPDGVAVVDPEEREVRRRLDGSYPLVTEAAVFTYGHDRVRRYPHSSSEPTWEVTLQQDVLPNATFGDGTLVFTTYETPAGDEPSRYRLYARDAETGDELWNETLARGEIIAGGLEGAPQISRLVYADGNVYAGTTSGLRAFDIETGERRVNGVEGVEDEGASSAIVAGGNRAYIEDRGFPDTEQDPDSELDVISLTGDTTPFSDAGARLVESLPLPDDVAFDVRDGDAAMYGRGVLYVTLYGYVYAFSGRPSLAD